MSERTNNIRFFLDSTQLGKKAIGDIKNPILVGGDKYALKDVGRFEVSKTTKVELYQTGYEYLLGVLLVYGPTAKVRLFTEVKDDKTPEQDWKRISDPYIDMYSLSFSEENDNRSVICTLIDGGDIRTLEASFRDDYDVVGVNVPELDYVDLRLDARRLIKRSRLKSLGIESLVIDDQGATARAVPLELDYTSQKNILGEVSNTFANAVNDNYADLTNTGNTIITNADIDYDYILNGTVTVRVVETVLGVIRMDLVRYSGAEDRTFEEVIEGTGTFGTIEGNELTLTFDNYPLRVLRGESIGLMTLSDTNGELRYEVDEASYLLFKTETPYPTTYTKAVRPRTMFKHLAGIILDDPKYPFGSSVFGPGGRHEDKLLVHGTWLRNMPQILNEGEDDERRIQANLSLSDLFDAYSLLEPLRYDIPLYKGKRTFTVGAFKDIQQNFTGLRVTGIQDPEELTEVSEKVRDVLGGNYYRKVKVGSETSGSNYGAVNNLFSTAGFAEWDTPNVESDDDYEVTTKFRTGAEDVEIQRQFQYSDNPDLDGDYDNDWFIVDAKPSGSEFVVKDWQDYYEEAPTGVYSAESNYNWPFAPVELLRGHGYKINAGLREVPEKFLTNPRGNCSLSLKTKRAGEQEITANLKFPIALLEKPRIRPMMVNFQVPLTQELVDGLRGQTRGVDNKFGLVEIKYNGETLKGRLFEVSTEKIAKFKIIEAIL